MAGFSSRPQVRFRSTPRLSLSRTISSLGHVYLAAHGRSLSGQAKNPTIFQANAFVTSADIELSKASHVAKPSRGRAGETARGRDRGVTGQRAWVYNSVTGESENLRIMSNLPPRGFAGKHSGPHMGTQVTQGGTAGYCDFPEDSGPSCPTSKPLQPTACREILVQKTCSVNDGFVLPAHTSPRCGLLHVAYSQGNADIIS